MTGCERWEQLGEWIKRRVVEEGGERGAELIRQLEEESKRKEEDRARSEENRKPLRDREIEKYNSETGTLTGYQCNICKNRGYIAVPIDDWWAVRPCKCEKIRKSIRNMQKSGLENMLKKYTLENFERNEWYAQRMYEIAERFLEGKAEWLYFGGQPGCGKTHLCTGVCGELLRRGNEIIYMLWRDEATKLKGMRLNGSDYAREISKYRDAEVLYIDDFLKTKRGDTPTTGDINIAFEILNSRYNDGKRTIISSEWTTGDIISFDQALGGRIYEKAKRAAAAIALDDAKDWRLREGL